MTTKELKSYIDRILGNNIRLLLPSYWWKRAFGAVIDKVDEKVEKSDLKTINGESVLGEGDLRVGVKSVESVEALEKLDAQVGDIATVGSESFSLVSSSYFPELVSSVDNIVEDWDSYKRIGKVEFGEPYSEEGRRISVYIHGKKKYPYDLIVVQCASGEFSCMYYTGVNFKLITLDEVNEKLRDSDYRVILVSKSEQADKTLKLYAYSASADAYIKSDSWEKLSKEYIVASEEELNSLDVPNGTIAKVACKTHREIKPSSCLDSMGNWESGARITKVNLSNTPMDGVAATLYAYEGSTLIGILGILYSNGELICEDHKSTSLSLDELNDRLLANEYKLVGANFIHLEDFDNTFRFYTEPITDVSDAYIKGETWTRLLKEGDVTGGGGFEHAVERTVHPTEGILGLTSQKYEITEEQRAYNIDTFSKIREGKNVIIVYGGTVISVFVHTSEKVECAAWNYPNIYSILTLYPSGEAIVKTLSSTDSELSTTSTFPIANKVVTAALNEKADISYVDSEVAKKVDKVSGKQLTTEDFTSALKAKLEGLSNYDDTEIENAVSSLQTQLNTLVSGNASDAINSFNEIIAFLDGVKDSESLDSIIASIEQQIASKQDKISDLDTIRANAAKGATALQSVPSEYVTESELNAKNFATTSQVNAKQDSISDLDTIRSNASLGATAIQKVKTINGESITGDGNVEIFTKAMHDELVENMLDNEEVYAAAVNDLNTRLAETNATIATEVSTRESLSNDVQSLTDRITSNEEVTATSYNELNTRIDNNYQHGETTYATKAELLEEITGMTNSIVENEEVIAATLNDLLARIDALVTRVEQLENV